MATDILYYNSVTVAPTITLNSLVTLTTDSRNVRQGTVIDFGTTRAEEWIARLAVTFAAAPTAGGTLDLYMGWANASNALPAGLSGSDGDYAGPDAVPAQGLQQLQFVGSLVACATGSTTVQTQDVGTFRAIKRYGAPVVAMRTSQTLVTATTTTHTLSLTDIRPQIQ